MQLVGFDARMALGTIDESWTDERREMYLLRTDVVQPLSTDRAVWPTPVGVDESMLSVPLPWVGLHELHRQLRGRVGRDDVVIVAIGVDDSGQSAVERLLGTEGALTAEASLQFLGFDVSDLALTSGLCNCGYDATDPVAELRSAWATKLNEHGLFSEASDATGFCAVTDVRVPEHSPFFVFALWIVPWSG
jgi:hypothetical protein